MDFTNQIAVITGGAQGIGRACAERIVKDGGCIAIWDIDKVLAEEAATELGNDSFACVVDVSDWASVCAARDATLEKAGRIDILINSAGIAGSNGPLEDYDVEEFAQIEPALRQLLETDLPALEEKMEAAGVPWTSGRPLPAIR